MISVAEKANGSGVRRTLVVLILLWAVLAARIGLALVRHESLAGDLSLPAFALFVVSAVLGSFAWERATRPAATEEAQGRPEQRPGSAL
jgi:hypothetical protein